MAKITKKSLRQIVRISEGNSKIGKILNLNQPPVITCPKNVPCATCGKCYSLKSWRQYPSVRESWSFNLDSVKNDSDSFFQAVSDFVKISNNNEFFRWHSSGDIIDTQYLEGMKKVALENPSTQFLAFTKNQEIDITNPPSNLVIIASQWGDYKWGENAPKAIVRLKDENWEIPKNSILCPGSCVSCKACWNLTEGQAVIFDEH